MIKFMKILAWFLAVVYFLILVCVPLMSPTGIEPVAYLPLFLLGLFVSAIIFLLFYSIAKNLEQNEKMISLLTDIRDAVGGKGDEGASEQTKEAPEAPKPAVSAVPEKIDEHTIRCPQCGTELRPEVPRCFQCGLIFSKPDEENPSL